MNRRILASFVPLVCLHAQDVAEQQAKLEHIRAMNLERAATLPSFVADEIAVRYKSKHVDPPQWEHVDTIESEVAVRGDGFGWSVAFGYEIKQLFDPECYTAIDYVGREEMHGKPALAYRFHEAPGGCFENFNIKNGFFSALKTFNPARTVPVATELFAGFARENLWHITVEYKNHRHFEASTNVKFH